MVNNVLREMREPTIASFSAAPNALDQGVLAAVNRAARFTLYSREWEFMKRWGELVTKAPVTGTTGHVTNGSFTINLAGVSTVGPITGDVVARVAVTDDAAYPNTSFRIVGGAIVGTFIGSLETAWPGTTNAGAADYSVFFAEYLLGEEVAGVYQVLYEEDTLKLHQADEISTRRAYPRLWETMGTPEIVAVGGTAVGTYDATGDVPDPKTRLLVYPVPDAAYALRYQYLLRFTELAEPTDTIPGLSLEVADRIEKLAYSDIQESDIGNDPAKAALVRSNFDRDTAALHRRSRQDKGRRFVLRSFDSMGHTETNFGRLPDDRLEG